MAYYQIQAVLSGNRTKTIINKTEEQTLIEFVLPFKSKQIIELNWGKKKHSYQVLEIRIFKTKELWDRKSGVRFEDFTQKSRNIFSYFEKKADKILTSKSHPVFIVMPILTSPLFCSQYQIEEVVPFNAFSSGGTPPEGSVKSC